MTPRRPASCGCGSPRRCVVSPRRSASVSRVVAAARDRRDRPDGGGARGRAARCAARHPGVPPHPVVPCRGPVVGAGSAARGRDPTGRGAPVAAGCVVRVRWHRPAGVRAPGGRFPRRVADPCGHRRAPVGAGAVPAVRRGAAAGVLGCRRVGDPRVGDTFRLNHPRGGQLRHLVCNRRGGSGWRF